MHILITILVWAAASVAALVLLAILLTVAEAVARRIARRRRSQRLGRLQVPAQPEIRSLALLVDVDEQSSLLRPSIQISGSPVRDASVRLELVDERGTVRLMLGRNIAHGGIGSEVPLPAFVPPPDLQVRDVLRWRWDVVLEDTGGELGRWQERPALAGAVNTEGELSMPVEGGDSAGLAGVPGGASMSADMAAFAEAFRQLEEIPQRLPDGTWGR